jgi:hypothetical protein
MDMIIGLIVIFAFSWAVGRVVGIAQEEEID